MCADRVHPTTPFTNAYLSIATLYDKRLTNLAIIVFRRQCIEPSMERPYIAVNCAASIDGRISSTSRGRVLLSGAEDLDRVRRLRARFDAIAVGINTVLADDPLLLPSDDKKWARKIKRVVFDSRGRTPVEARVLKYGGTVIFTSTECRATFQGAETYRYGRKRVDIGRALSKLHSLGVRRLLVEGGGEIIYELFRLRVVDSLTIYTAPVIIGGRGAPSVADGDGFSVGSFPKMKMIGCRKLGEGIITKYESYR